jgi:nucleotide-binding universal stress UspA family protein
VQGSHSVFLEGSAGPAICEWASGSAVDLLVTGAHHGRAQSLLLGSVSGHLVNHAPCPVLVVRLWPRRPDPAPLTVQEVTS